MRPVRLAATEPAAIAGLVQGLVALVIACGLNLTPGQSGSIEAAVAAVLAAVVAARVRPVPVAALAGAMTAVGTLLMAFGVPHVTAGSVSAVNAVLAAGLALILRGHVTPVAAAVTPPPAAPASGG